MTSHLTQQSPQRPLFYGSQCRLSNFYFGTKVSCTKEKLHNYVYGLQIYFSFEIVTAIVTEKNKCLLPFNAIELKSKSA